MGTWEKCSECRKMMKRLSCLFCEAAFAILFCVKGAMSTRPPVAAISFANTPPHFKSSLNACLAFISLLLC